METGILYIIVFTLSLSTALSLPVHQQEIKNDENSDEVIFVISKADEIADGKKLKILEYRDSSEITKQESEDEDKNDKNVKPLTDLSQAKGNGADCKKATLKHSLVKRQAFDSDFSQFRRRPVYPSFYVYRPVVQIRRNAVSRRRVYRPRHALVGYLSDRDNFPTVA